MPLLVVADSFKATSAYDALNRVTSSTAPDASTIVPTYNEANLLAATRRQRSPRRRDRDLLRLEPRLQRQGAARPRRLYANGTTTTYSYDPLTFLLIEQATTRAKDSAKLQRLRPQCVRPRSQHRRGGHDNADQALYFSGSSAGRRWRTLSIRRDLSTRELDQGGNILASRCRIRTTPCLASLPHPNDTQAMQAYTEKLQLRPGRQHPPGAAQSRGRRMDRDTTSMRPAAIACRRRACSGDPAASALIPRFIATTPAGT